MEVAMWCTYLERPDEEIMHFGILVPPKLNNPAVIHLFGQEYLDKKKQNLMLNKSYCKFCHVGEASPEVQKEIEQKGYYILELGHCNFKPK